MQYLTNVARSPVLDGSLTDCLTEVSAAVQRLTSSGMPGLPVRPLLYAAGAAAAAAGVYYYFRKHNVETTQDPVQAVSADAALSDSDLVSDVIGVSVTDTVPDSTVSEYSRSEAKENNEMVEVSSAPLDRERSQLEDRVRELEELLSEAYRENERKNKECEQLREAHTVLRSEYCMLDNEKLLKATVAEAESKNELATESSTRLQYRNSELVAQINTLQQSVQQLEDQQAVARVTYYEIKEDCEREQKAQRSLRSENRRLLDIERSLKATVAEAERKYDQAMMCNAQLKHRNLELIAQVNTLQVSVQRLEAHGVVKETFSETKKATVAEDGSDWVMKSNTRLQYRNTELLAQVNTLQQSVQQLEDQQAEARELIYKLKEDNKQKGLELSTQHSRHSKTTELLLNDYNGVCLAQTKVMSQYYEMKEKHDKLQKEREQLREAHAALRTQYDKMKATLSDNEISHMVTLASAATAHGQVKELEKENSDQTYHVHKLRGTVKQLEEMLYETNRTCDMLKQDLEFAREACNILRSEHEEAMTRSDP